MEKRFRFLGTEIVVTDEDREFIDEIGDRVKLSEEWGWWDDGRIWIWAGREVGGFVQKWGIGVHEFVEKLLVKKLGVKKEKAHKVANAVEKVLTLGRSKTF
ncbi:MAG: hypothetical protein QXR39_08990 [Candidatus Methanomethylicia archaeon]